MISVRSYDTEMKIVRTYPVLQWDPQPAAWGAGHSQIHQIPVLAPQVSWDFDTPHICLTPSRWPYSKSKLWRHPCCFI